MSGNFEIYLTVEIGESFTPNKEDMDGAIRAAVAAALEKHAYASCIKVDQVLDKTTEQEIEGDWEEYAHY